MKKNVNIPWALVGIGSAAGLLAYVIPSFTEYVGIAGLAVAAGLTLIGLDEGLGIGI